MKISPVSNFEAKKIKNIRNELAMLKVDSALPQRFYIIAK